MKQWKVIVPLIGMALSGCFATQNDIRVLQGDLGLVRSEAAAADSMRRIQLSGVLATLQKMDVSLREMNDTIVTLNTRMFHFRSDMSTSMASVQQQLLQVQELTGQSQRRLQDLRASMEQRQEAQQRGDATAAVSPTTDSQPARDATPGPNQLFQVARQQMIQGSYAASRTAFQDMLTKYPQSDLTADAQFYIAFTYELEGNASAADSAYANMAAAYPKSAHAATAVYKQAVLAQKAGSRDKALQLFNQVIKKYPRSDEASLARDRVKALAK
jgi:tol-pal system protein YbgF